MKSQTVILALSLWVTSAFAQYDFSAIDSYVQEAKQQVGLPTGTAIAIVQDGKVIYQGYFGYANIQAQRPITANTAFYIASVTKPMFALSTLLLEHQAKIKSSTSLQAMFPTHTFAHIDSSKIQLSDLLAHTSGLANTPLVSALAFTGNHDRLQRNKLVAETVLDQSSKLGQYKYSNLGYNLASIWLDDYLQQDWQQSISELIYQPLGMQRTSSYMSDSIGKGFEVARPYDLASKDPSEILSFEKNNQTMHSAGGTISTATDIARFLIAQLNQGRVDGKAVLPAEVIAKSHQQLAETDLRFRDFIRKGYAWGWYIGPYKGQQMYHHFGGVAGTHSHASFMLQHNIGLVILNNEAWISSKLSNAIADIAYSILLNEGDANALANKHILDMQQTWQRIKPKLQESIKSATKRVSSRTMQLSQTTAKYAGTYQHPLWGELKIKLLDSGNFSYALGGLKAVATAYTKVDTMRIEFPVLGGGKVVTFKIHQGRVTALEVMGLVFNKA